MITISVKEFARRLKTSLGDQDCKFAFFLGAGCSISSGIPGAATLVKEWLPRIKSFEDGNIDNIDDWATNKFALYDSNNLAAIYGEVYNTLFYFDEDGQKEIEKLVECKDPGFGYAVLAQLISHNTYGKHCNVVFTTNFDDLVGDALYLYTNRKPLIISHESLVDFIRIGRTRPLVIKLHGDAKLFPKNRKKDTARLTESMSVMLRGFLGETGLIFAGYGGNDLSITTILKALPKNAVPWGIYWIGESIPNNQLGEWLEDKGAILVKHFDFDEVMLLMRNEFDFEHPDEKRLSKIMDSYKGTFKLLMQKIEGKESSKEKDDLKEAAEKAVNDFDESWSMLFAARNLEKTDPEKAKALYQQGLHTCAENSLLLGSYARFLSLENTDIDLADSLFLKALSIDPYDASILNNYGAFLFDCKKDIEKAEGYYKEALAIDPTFGVAQSNYCQLLFFTGKHDAAIRLLRNLESEKANNEILINCYFYCYAHFLIGSNGVDCLIKLKKQLLISVRNYSSNYQSSIARAIEDGHPEPEFLKVLADVICDKAPLESLDNFEVWRNIKV